MSEPQVGLVHSQTFAIDLPPISPPVTVGADSDEIVVVVRVALRPRDNVVNIDFDVSASRDGASVASFDKYSPPEFSGYWWPIIPV